MNCPQLPSQGSLIPKPAIPCSTGHRTPAECHAGVGVQQEGDRPRPGVGGNEHNDYVTMIWERAATALVLLGEREVGGKSHFTWGLREEGVFVRQGREGRITPGGGCSMGKEDSEV